MTVTLIQVPQAGQPGKRFDYALDGRELTATLYEVAYTENEDGQRVEAERTELASEVYDFSSLDADEVAEIEPVALQATPPIVRAETDENGDLEIVVVNWYGPTAGEARPDPVTEVFDE